MIVEEKKIVKSDTIFLAFWEERIVSHDDRFHEQLVQVDV